MIRPHDILDFWFSDEAEERWFSSTPEFDAVIRERFEEAAVALAAGRFPNPVWESFADDALALVIALDQFPRNMYRGTARAYAWDPMALGVAQRMVEREQDLALAADRRRFAYMPFMHAEDLAMQERCVELCGERLDDGGATLGHAVTHRDIIARFGRFPHRNDELGRESTAEEIAFLQDGGFNPD